MPGWETGDANASPEIFHVVINEKEKTVALIIQPYSCQID